MTIRDILKMTAVYIDRVDILDALESEITENEQLKREIDILMRLSNGVLNELATEYLPMIKCEAFTTEDGKVYYSRFQRTPVKIRRIIDDKLKPLSFSPAPEFLSTQKGIVAIEYEYLPPSYDLDDEIGYQNTEISPRVISYGVACEYSLVKNKYDESVMWNKRFKEALLTVTRPKKVKTKGRRWQ